MQYLQPTAILEPRQLNAGATQQPLPIASSSQPTITEIPRPTEPRGKSRPRPSPKTSPTPRQPNFPVGGASGSGGGAPPPPQPQQQEINISELEKQSRSVLFPEWGSKRIPEMIHELSNIPFNDYSQINPRNVDYRTLQELFIIEINYHPQKKQKSKKPLVSTIEAVLFKIRKGV